MRFSGSVRPEVSKDCEAHYPQGKPQAWRIWALTSKMPNPVFFYSTSMRFAKFRCRSVAAAGDSLFFCFAKSKVSKRKGDPGVCDPPLRCGHLPVLSPAGIPLELATLRQSRALIRLGFRSSAHSQGFCRGGSDSESDSGIRSGRIGATNTIAAYARITWARGQNYLKERRAAWFLGSDRNFAAQHP